MHVVDVTMFYAGGGGGVTTYLDAKARWLGGHTAIRHTIASSNLPRQAAGSGPLWPRGPQQLAAIDSFALPGLHGYRMPRSAAAVARVLLALQPELIEAGDAGPCGWGAVRAKQRLGVPLVGFYHSDLPQLVGRRFGAAAALAAQQYVRRLYRHCDLLLAPSAAMVRRLAAMGLSASRQPLGVDTAIFHPGRADGGLRAELGLPASARLLAYAGRFNASKQLELLGGAVRRLGAPYHLLLIGGRVRRRNGPVSVLPFQSSPRAGAPAGRLRRAGARGRQRNLRPDRARGHGLRLAGRGHQRRRHRRAGAARLRHRGGPQQREQPVRGRGRPVPARRGGAGRPGAPPGLRPVRLE